MIFNTWNTRPKTAGKTKSKFSSLFSLELSSSSFLFTFFCSNELSRKKEKNNDRLRSHDCTRTRPGHPHESRNDERDEEEIGYLARMGERFKGIISRENHYSESSQKEFKISSSSSWLLLCLSSHSRCSFAMIYAYASLYVLTFAHIFERELIHLSCDSKQTGRTSAFGNAWIRVRAKTSQEFDATTEFGFIGRLATTRDVIPI